jgi:hypothetical protein
MIPKKAALGLAPGGRNRFSDRIMRLKNVKNAGKLRI